MRWMLLLLVLLAASSIPAVTARHNYSDSSGYSASSSSGSSGAYECEMWEDATEDCMHMAECVGSNCQCWPGWVSRTCGYDVDNCGCLDCGHGYMTNDSLPAPDYVHYCACDDGWHGQNCDICVDVETCEPYFPYSNDTTCDTSPVVTNFKNFDCTVKSDAFPGAKIGVQMDGGVYNGTGIGAFQAWMIAGNRDLENEYLKEAFYCDLFDCDIVVDGYENVVTYECVESKCYITDYVYLSPFIISIIEGANGESSLTCRMNSSDGLLDCELYQESLAVFFPAIPISCFTGECLGQARKIIVPS